MKIRSLLLGSVAAAGLSTGGAYAADLGVLTSLDVCDALGLSGLTISSDTNCLQITGEVKYKFKWGDYDDEDLVIETAEDDGDVAFFGGDGLLDWESRFDAWIKFVATADSDFGPAKAVLKLKEIDGKSVTDETSDLNTEYEGTDSAWQIGSDTNGVILDEAYVSIGDSTVIMAGRKGSIINKGDDEPLNWLGLFNSEDVDTGVNWGPDVAIGTGNHVIQVVSDLGNGVTVGAGLENLVDSDDPEEQGTAVGVISYAGEGISAHLSVAAAGVLDGEVESWGAHAGFAGTFDAFKVVLAGAFGHDDPSASDYWNVLASASATFDMFTIAVSGEATSAGEWGVGGSVSAAVTDDVTINLGSRLWSATGPDVWQAEAGISAKATETITVTAAIGAIDGNGALDPLVIYGKAGLAWAPGGGFTASVEGKAQSNGAFKGTFKAAKTIK